MKPWSPLPNAHIIDWVVKSLRAAPGKWASAHVVTKTADRVAAWDAAQHATQTANRVATWDAALRAARRAARVVAQHATQTAAWNSAWYSILALVAYDDCQQYLNMSYEQLLTYAVLSERPQAVLLLPLKWVQEHECLVTST